MEVRHSKTVKNLLSLARVAVFLEECSLDCCQPLFNFQSLKNLILIDFANVFLAALEEQIFRGPYSVILKGSFPVSFYNCSIFFISLEVLMIYF